MFFFVKKRKSKRGRPLHRDSRLEFEPLEPRQLLAITASIDYSFDTQNFFNTQAKRDLLQLAADSVASRLDDTLSAIIPSGGNTWSARFVHPGTGAQASASNPQVQANEIIIYAGGRELGSTLGEGGPGGFSSSGSTAWNTTVRSRGESNTSGNNATDFGPWGGQLTFDRTTNWHFGETTIGLGSGEFDFLSTALHEISHLLGFGASDSWDADVSGGTFTGPAAVAEYDLAGNVPLSGSNHWQEGTTDGGQDVAMDPTVNAGTRKLLTRLDLAGLIDVGWEIDLDAAGLSQFEINANDPALADWFGYSVDIEGDLAVVGAKLDDGGGSNSGSVYIFQQLVDDTWTQIKKLTASDAQAGDQFGHDVAISGDTIVVGAWIEDANNINSGSAYVFERNLGGTNNWGQVEKLIGSDTTPADKFGWSVDIDGDTIVVGAFEDDPSGSASGAAYVFERNQGGTNNWGEAAKLAASDGAAIDKFGNAVSIASNTIAVGAYLEDGGGVNSGSVYIFSRNQGGANNWGQLTKIVAPDAAANDHFGYSVALADNNRVVVGAWLDDFSSGAFRSNAGSVAVFERNQGGTNNWGQTGKSFANDPGAGDRLGASIDVDGSSLLAGAQFDDGAFSNSGSAYLFNRNQGGTNNWGQVQKRTDPTGRTNDNFGISVALDGDVGIVGSYVGDSATINNSGTAHINYFSVTAGPAARTENLSSLSAVELQGRPPVQASNLAGLDAHLNGGLDNNPPSLPEPLEEARDLVRESLEETGQQVRDALEGVFDDLASAPDRVRGALEDALAEVESALADARHELETHLGDHLNLDCVDRLFENFGGLRDCVGGFLPQI